MAEIQERFKTKLNPPEQTALRPAEPAKRGLQTTVPPMVAQPRPMPPAPPKGPDQKPRGIPPSPGLANRPPTPYALELEERGRLKPGQTICPLCGNTKMVNTVRNKKNEIVKFEACPRCVDTTPAE